MIQVLDLSLQFYEAQRSGPLPADNRSGELRLGTISTFMLNIPQGSLERRL